MPSTPRPGAPRRDLPKLQALHHDPQRLRSVDRIGGRPRVFETGAEHSAASLGFVGSPVVRAHRQAGGGKRGRIPRSVDLVAVRAGGSTSAAMPSPLRRLFTPGRVPAGPAPPSRATAGRLPAMPSPVAAGPRSPLTGPKPAAPRPTSPGRSRPRLRRSGGAVPVAGATPSNVSATGSSTSLPSPRVVTSSPEASPPPSLPPQSGSGPEPVGPRPGRTAPAASRRTGEVAARGGDGGRSHCGSWWGHRGGPPRSWTPASPQRAAIGGRGGSRAGRAAEDLDPKGSPPRPEPSPPCAPPRAVLPDRRTARGHRLRPPMPDGAGARARKGTSAGRKGRGAAGALQGAGGSGRARPAARRSCTSPGAGETATCPADPGRDGRRRRCSARRSGKPVRDLSIHALDDPVTARGRSADREAGRAAGAGTDAWTEGLLDRLAEPTGGVADPRPSGRGRTHGRRRPTRRRRRCGRRRPARGSRDGHRPRAGRDAAARVPARARRCRGPEPRPQGPLRAAREGPAGGDRWERSSWAHRCRRHGPGRGDTETAGGR